MITIVLAFNTIVACLCFIVAWKVWRLRGVLSRVADTLLIAEKSTRVFLQEAPDAIYRGQMGVYQIREQHWQLKPQLRNARQILGLIRWGQTFWLSWLGSMRSIKQPRKGLYRPTRRGSTRLR